MFREIEHPQFKHALVTGGTKGIGREIAMGLAAAGTHVIIVGRNAETGREAQKIVIDQTGNPHVIFLAHNISSAAGRRELASKVREITPGGLDLLVNNAGFTSTKLLGREFTADGHDLIVATNLFGPMDLTRQLHGNLDEASQRTGERAHVLGISSTAANHAEITTASLEDPDFHGLLNRFFANKRIYGWSKRAYNLAIAKHAELYPDIQINNLNPGVTDTTFNQGAGGLVGLINKRFNRTISRLRNAVPPEVVANTLLALAATPDLPNGASFNMDLTLWEPRGRDIADPLLRQELWRVILRTSGVH